MMALFSTVIGMPVGILFPVMNSTVNTVMNSSTVSTPVELHETNGTLGGRPAIRYVVLSSDRDRASCVGENPATSRYFDASPGICFPLEEGAGVQYLKMFVSANGINVMTYSDSACRRQIWASGVTPFGGCVDVGVKFTLDVASFLPAPNPGQALIKQFIGHTTCTAAPIYMLITTSCWQLGGPGTNDIEVFCGEGNYDAFNEMTWNIYGSKSGQCTGKAYKADRVNVLSLFPLSSLSLPSSSLLFPPLRSSPLLFPPLSSSC